ncbi:MAG: GNAT family N-acetyltransferase, partial [Acidobacteriaceae bacterium]
MPNRTTPDLSVRPARPADAAICGEICYGAFSTINLAHGFASDFPTSQAATGLLTTLFSSPGLY